MRPNLMRSAVAESIGTFALIFVGVLSISALSILGAPNATANLVGVAFAHGLTIAVMVAALGAVSGGHFNPAITLGFVITGRMRLGTGAIYWLSQLVGATLAALLISALFGVPAVATGTTNLGTNVSFMAGVLAEAVATFFLVLVVFGTAVDERSPKSVFPFAIGLTITLGILAIGPLTGGALNPARAFGPALVSGSWSNQLVYWIGPLIGGALAALVEDRFLIQRAPAAPQETMGGPTLEEERQRGRAA
jgi:aquaporin TIP